MINFRFAGRLPARLATVTVPFQDRAADRFPAFSGDPIAAVPSEEFELAHITIREGSRNPLF